MISTKPDSDILLNKTDHALIEAAKEMGLNIGNRGLMRRLRAVLNGRGIHYKNELRIFSEQKFQAKDDEKREDNDENEIEPLEKICLRFSYLGSIKPKGAKLYNRPNTLNRKNVVTQSNSSTQNHTQ